MNAHPGLSSERLQDVPGKRRIELADERRHAFRLAVNHIRAPGKID
jgi:hypothetical protein